MIEDIAEPHQFVLNGFSVDLLEVFDVNYILRGVAKEEGFLEDDLLSVWEELSVPAEVVLLDPSPRHKRE